MIKVQRILFIIMAVIVIGGGLTPNYAHAKISSPTEGTKSAKPTYGEGSTVNLSLGFSIQSTQYFKSGNNYINLISNGIVRVGGDTQAYTPVDNIEVHLYLQRWDEIKGLWGDVINIGGFALNQSSIVQGSKDVTVVKGYYYRTRSVHTVTEAGIVEQKTAYSSYIFIN